MFGWRQTINHTINEADLHLVYQPIVSLIDESVVGYEALSRFPPFEGETLSPDRWYTKAFELGLGEELEITAVTLALEAIPRLPPDTYLSVNASASTILLEPFVVTILSRFADRICVELTEHDVVENYETLTKQLARIRRMDGTPGAKLAIDDVGSGFSNLVHVLMLQPDIFKLDRVLVDGIVGDRVKQEAVRALATFGRNLGISVVAEGIETEREGVTLVSCGVPYGQGKLFGMPGELP